jgi:hypothetical protein
MSINYKKLSSDLNALAAKAREEADAAWGSGDKWKAYRLEQKALRYRRKAQKASSR